MILDSFYDTTMKELKKTHIHVQDVTFDIIILICISLIILKKIELNKNCIVPSVTVFSYKVVIAELPHSTITILCNYILSFDYRMNKNASIILNNDEAIFTDSTRCENHLYEYRCIIDTSLSYITFYMDMLIIVLATSDVDIALKVTLLQK